MKDRIARVEDGLVRGARNRNRNLHVQSRVMLSAEDELIDPRALRRLRRLEGSGRELEGGDKLAGEDDASTSGTTGAEDDVPTAGIHNQDDHAGPHPSGGGDGVAQARASDIHGQSDHDAPESTASLFAATDEEWQDTIECDPDVLSLNQLIHCNGKRKGAD